MKAEYLYSIGLSKQTGRSFVTRGVTQDDMALVGPGGERSCDS
jgi:hypothetical protein